mmetsp:Transcript_1408/g.3072  ORF Transcript_1408/g.3072 Transcript_1408/m.3072 type:complete len:91 (+) Transcript_1408:92-364(+)
MIQSAACRAAAASFRQRACSAGMKRAATRASLRTTTATPLRVGVSQVILDRYCNTAAAATATIPQLNLSLSGIMPEIEECEVEEDDDDGA